jgi:phosphoglucomutase
LTSTVWPVIHRASSEAKKAMSAAGTENIYKIYAESFKDQAHLDAIVREAEAMVNRALQR